MITARVATELRRRVVGTASAHGGLTSLIIGVLTWTWAKLAPVRTQVAAWVDVAVARVPDGVTWLPLAVTAAAVVGLAAGALVLLRARRPSPVRVRRTTPGPR